MNTKPKRERPRSTADRRRLAEVNTRLNRARLTDEERTELEAERDVLAPIKVPFVKREPIGSDPQSTAAHSAEPEACGKSILSEKEPHSLRERTEGEFERRDTRRAAESDGVLAKRTPEEVEAYIKGMSDRLTEGMHSDPVRRRRCSAHHLALTTDNPLRTYANAFENPSGAMWTALISDGTSPGVKPEWLSDLFAEVDRRYAADPDWFRRAYENGTAFKAAAPVIAPAQAKPEAQPHPLVAVNADLDARATLVLTSDSWLSNLAALSDNMRSRIIVELGNEIRRVGHVDAAFCARLYGALRPTGVAKYPPRT